MTPPGHDGGPGTKSEATTRDITRSANNTAFDNILAALEAHGCMVRDNGHGRAQAQCPAHEDHNPSLSVGPRRDGDGVVLHCHAGCASSDVVAPLGLTMADLFDEGPMRDAWAPRRDYVYPGGRTVHRKPGKNFPQSGNMADRNLFHADRIDDNQKTIYVPEGEKDVEVIEAAGGFAVCSTMGAGKAHKSDWAVLKKKNVVIIADKDDAGRKHARSIAKILHGIAACVSIVEAKEGKDVADHIAAGFTLGDLVDPTREGMPRLWRAADLQPVAQPSWLAKHRLPRAAVALLIGDEGIGKSLLWVWVAAAVTTGDALPAFGIPARTPALVFIVITEDDWSSTVLPRLKVAGANLAMIRVICTETDGSGSPVFPRDINLIAEAEPAPALIVVDAWLDTVPAGLSVRDPQQARQALHPWKEIATTTQAAVLLLCHTNRVTSPNARDRYGATGELRKKARMTLYAQQDADGNLLVGPEKMNTAAPIPASMFTITAVPLFDATEDHDGTVPLLTYLGETDQTAREHIAEAYTADRDPSGGTDTLSWLVVFLAVGPRWAIDVYAEGKKAGHTEWKLRAAKLSLHAKATKHADGRWVWRMPQEQGEEPVPIVPHLRAFNALPADEKQGEPSTSEENKRMNRETKATSNGVGPPRFCPGCGTHWVTHGQHRADCTAASNGGTA